MPRRDRADDLRESLDDLPDAFRYGVQKSQYVEAFPKLYKDGKAGFELHLRIRSGDNDGDAQYFIARLRRIARHGMNVIGDHPSGHISPYVTGRELAINGHGVAPMKSGFVHGAYSQVNGPVLIDIIDTIESAEHGEGMVVSGVLLGAGHKVERLEVLELSGVVGAHEFPILPAIPLVDVEDDGELNFFDFPFAGRLDRVEVLQGKLPSDVIERTPEIMCSISHEQTPILARLHDALNAPYDRPLFRLIFPAKGNGYSVCGLFNPSVVPQGFDMYSRAIEFRPCA